ncbi:MAG: glutaredoxin family protein [bacterium]|nr:glutaredoxin family protein [bacterium]
MSTASVTVYSTTWCGYCKMLKEYLKGKGVAFNEVNIEEDREAGQRIIDKTGQMGVPVTEIGDKVIIGFDRPRVDAALQEHKLI